MWQLVWQVRELYGVVVRAKCTVVREDVYVSTPDPSRKTAYN